MDVPAHTKQAATQQHQRISGGWLRDRSPQKGNRALSGSHRDAKPKTGRSGSRSMSPGCARRSRHSRSRSRGRSTGRGRAKESSHSRHSRSSSRGSPRKRQHDEVRRDDRAVSGGSKRSGSRERARQIQCGRSSRWRSVGTTRAAWTPQHPPTAHRDSRRRSRSPDYARKQDSSRRQNRGGSRSRSRHRSSSRSRSRHRSTSRSRSRGRGRHRGRQRAHSSSSSSRERSRSARRNRGRSDRGGSPSRAADHSPSKGAVKQRAGTHAAATAAAAVAVKTVGPDAAGDRCERPHQPPTRNSVPDRLQPRQWHEKGRYGHDGTRSGSSSREHQQPQHDAVQHVQAQPEQQQQQQQQECRLGASDVRGGRGRPSSPQRHQDSKHSSGSSVKLRPAKHASGSGDESLPGGLEGSAHNGRGAVTQPGRSAAASRTDKCNHAADRDDEHRQQQHQQQGPTLQPVGVGGRQQHTGSSREQPGLATSSRPGDAVDDGGPGGPGEAQGLKQAPEGSAAGGPATDAACPAVLTTSPQLPTCSSLVVVMADDPHHPPCEGEGIELYRHQRVRQRCTGSTQQQQQHTAPPGLQADQAADTPQPGAPAVQGSAEVPAAAQGSPAAAQGSAELPAAVQGSPAAAQGSAELPAAVQGSPAAAQGSAELPAAAQGSPAAAQGSAELPAAVQGSPAAAQGSAACTDGAAGDGGGTVVCVDEAPAAGAPAALAPPAVSSDPGSEEGDVTHILLTCWDTLAEQQPQQQQEEQQQQPQALPHTEQQQQQHSGPGPQHEQQGSKQEAAPSHSGDRPGQQQQQREEAAQPQLVPVGQQQQDSATTAAGAVCSGADQQEVPPPGAQQQQQPPQPQHTGQQCTQPELAEQQQQEQPQQGQALPAEVQAGASTGQTSADNSCREEQDGVQQQQQASQQPRSNCSSSSSSRANKPVKPCGLVIPICQLTSYNSLDPTPTGLDAVQAITPSVVVVGTDPLMITPLPADHHAMQQQQQPSAPPAAAQVLQAPPPLPPGCPPVAPGVAPSGGTTTGTSGAAPDHTDNSSASSRLCPPLWTLIVSAGPGDGPPSHALAASAQEDVARTHSAAVVSCLALLREAEARYIDTRHNLDAIQRQRWCVCDAATGRQELSAPLQLADLLASYPQGKSAGGEHVHVTPVGKGLPSSLLYAFTDMRDKEQRLHRELGANLGEVDKRLSMLRYNVGNLLMVFSKRAIDDITCESDWQWLNPPGGVALPPRKYQQLVDSVDSLAPSQQTATISLAGATARSSKPLRCNLAAVQRKLDEAKGVAAAVQGGLPDGAFCLRQLPPFDDSTPCWLPWGDNSMGELLSIHHIRRSLANNSCPPHKLVQHATDSQGRAVWVYDLVMLGLLHSEYAERNSTLHQQQQQQQQQQEALQAQARLCLVQVQPSLPPQQQQQQSLPVTQGHSSEVLPAAQEAQQQLQPEELAAFLHEFFLQQQGPSGNVAGQQAAPVQQQASPSDSPGWHAPQPHQGQQQSPGAQGAHTATAWQQQQQQHSWQQQQQHPVQMRQWQPHMQQQQQGVQPHCQPQQYSHSRSPLPAAQQRHHWQQQQQWQHQQQWQQQAPTAQQQWHQAHHPQPLQQHPKQQQLLHGMAQQHQQHVEAYFQGQAPPQLQQQQQQRVSQQQQQQQPHQRWHQPPEGQASGPRPARDKQPGGSGAPSPPAPCTPPAAEQVAAAATAPIVSGTAAADTAAAAGPQPAPEAAIAAAVPHAGRAPPAPQQVRVVRRCVSAPQRLYLAQVPVRLRAAVVLNRALPWPEDMGDTQRAPFYRHTPAQQQPAAAGAGGRPAPSRAGIVAAAAGVGAGRLAAPRTASGAVALAASSTEAAAAGVAQSPGRSRAPVLQQPAPAFAGHNAAARPQQEPAQQQQQRQEVKLQRVQGPSQQQKHQARVLQKQPQALLRPKQQQQQDLIPFSVDATHQQQQAVLGDQVVLAQQHSPHATAARSEGGAAGAGHNHVPTEAGQTGKLPSSSAAASVAAATAISDGGNGHRHSDVQQQQQLVRSPTGKVAEQQSPVDAAGGDDDDDKGWEVVVPLQDLSHVVVCSTRLQQQELLQPHLAGGEPAAAAPLVARPQQQVDTRECAGSSAPPPAVAATAWIVQQSGAVEVKLEATADHQAPAAEVQLLPAHGQAEQQHQQLQQEEEQEEGEQQADQHLPLQQQQQDQHEKGAQQADQLMRPPPHQQQSAGGPATACAVVCPPLAPPSPAAGVRRLSVCLPLSPAAALSHTGWPAAAAPGQVLPADSPLPIIPVSAEQKQGAFNPASVLGAMLLTPFEPCLDDIQPLLCQQEQQAAEQPQQGPQPQQQPSMAAISAAPKQPQQQQQQQGQPVTTAPLAAQSQQQQPQPEEQAIEQQVEQQEQQAQEGKPQQQSLEQQQQQQPPQEQQQAVQQAAPPPSKRSRSAAAGSQAAGRAKRRELVAVNAAQRAALAALDPLTQDTAREAMGFRRRRSTSSSPAAKSSKGKQDRPTPAGTPAASQQQVPGIKPPRLSSVLAASSANRSESSTTTTGLADGGSTASTSSKLVDGQQAATKRGGARAKKRKLGDASAAALSDALAAAAAVGDIDEATRREIARAARGLPSSRSRQQSQQQRMARTGQPVQQQQEVSKQLVRSRGSSPAAASVAAAFPAAPDAAAAAAAGPTSRARSSSAPPSNRASSVDPLPSRLDGCSRALDLGAIREAVAAWKKPGYCRGMHQALVRREKLSDTKTAAATAGVRTGPYSSRSVVPFALPACLLGSKPGGKGAGGVSSSSREGSSPASGGASGRGQRNAQTPADVSKRRGAAPRGKQLVLQRSCVHGAGLFAGERITADEFVVEYKGMLIRPVLEDVMERRYVAQGQDSSYLFRLDKSRVADATVSGGLARYINHSCEPNCYTKVFNGPDGVARMGIYAKRDIDLGEELAYDYMFEFEEGDRRVPCCCGAPSCRGFMN